MKQLRLGTKRRLRLKKRKGEDPNATRTAQDQIHFEQTTLRKKMLSGQ